MEKSASRNGFSIFTAVDKFVTIVTPIYDIGHGWSIKNAGFLPNNDIGKGKARANFIQN